jgi:hypothetical protein
VFRGIGPQYESYPSRPKIGQKPQKALKNGQFQEKPAKNLWKSAISH